jgi:anti-anti-sigma regulatory factor
MLVYIGFRGYSAKTAPPHADESRRSVNFELSIAMKRDIERIPARTEARIAGDGPPVLRLNGALDERATDEIVSAVLRTVDEHGHAILIEMERVTNDDPACLYELAKHVMGLRGDGIDVQVFVHEADLHARMAAIDDARDWLMERANTDASSPRKAIHLDGPR